MENSRHEDAIMPTPPGVRSAAEYVVYVDPVSDEGR
jgi:hypothetical protein